MDTLLENFKSGNLTKGQRTLISEVMAHQSEVLFGSEQMIVRLTKTNRSLAEKILDRIKQFLQVFSAKTPEERAIVRRFQRAGQLFEQALGKAGTKYAVREMQSAEKGDVVLDGEGVVGYNNTVPQFSAKRAKYISYDKLGASNVAFIRRQLYKLYQGVENGIANSVAIENGNTVYIVDSGCENGDISFGVRERIKILDDELRSEYVRRTNDDAVSKGHISDGLSSRFGARHDNGRESNLRRESGAELSADTAESADIQGGVSAGDADRGRSGVTQYSRKRQSDAAYTEAQYRDFGWVRDNDVIPSGAWQDFTSKFAAALSGREHPPKTKGGEYMIAVSDIDDPQTEGVNNIIVYATGTMESPKVSRVLMIDLDNETSLDKRRRRIYDAGRRGIQPQAGGIFRLYNSTDFGGRFYEQSERSKMRRDNSQLGADRGRGSKTSDRIKEFKVNEDGSFTTVYADGRTEVQYSRKPTGAAIKAEADVERLRVYTKKDAEAIIADVVGQYMVFESEGVYGQLVGKSQREAIEALWRGLNSAEPGMQGGVALDIAEYIINNATVASVWEQDTTEQTEEAKHRLAILRGLMHKLDLSSIKDEIAHRLDDKKGTAYLVWGARKGEITNSNRQGKISPYISPCCFIYRHFYTKDKFCIKKGTGKA